MSRVDELIAQLCPDSVPQRPLGDVCTVFSGFAFNSAHFNTEGIGVPLIRIRDINTGHAGTFYSGAHDERFMVRDGDIVIGMDGDFRVLRWMRGPALLNQRVCRLQSFSALVLPDFVYYIVQVALRRIHETTQQSTVKHLSSRVLTRTPIPVPPLEVQREIVRILDTFAELEAEL